MVYTVCYIYVRDGERSRLAHRKRDLTMASRYPIHIRRGLIAVSPTIRDAGLTANSPPHEFHCHVGGMDRHVVGMALMRPLWSPNILTYLTEAQQAVRKFWLSAKYSECDLMFVELAAAQ